MSFRSSIRDGLKELILSEMDGTKLNLTGGPKYYNNIYQNVFSQSKSFKDIIDYPAVTITTGPETFEYLLSGLRWNYLRLYIRCYVSDSDDAAGKLELLLEDIKNLIDEFDYISYTITKPDGTVLNMQTTQTTLEEVSTDEGLLAPLGIGEIVLTIRYSQDSRLV